VPHALCAIFRICNPGWFRIYSVSEVADSRLDSIVSSKRKVVSSAAETWLCRPKRNNDIRPPFSYLRRKFYWPFHERLSHYVATRVMG
jgi:hypothetical protein